MLFRSLAEGAARIYDSGKEFAYDHVFRDKVVTFAKGTDTRLNIKVKVISLVLVIILGNTIYIWEYQ